MIQRRRGVIRRPTTTSGRRCLSDRFFVGLGVLLYLLVQIVGHSQLSIRTTNSTIHHVAEILRESFSAGLGRRLGADDYNRADSNDLAIPAEVDTATESHMSVSSQQNMPPTNRKRQTNKRTMMNMRVKPTHRRGRNGRKEATTQRLEKGMHGDDEIPSIETLQSLSLEELQVLWRERFRTKMDINQMMKKTLPMTQKTPKATKTHGEQRATQEQRKTAKRKHKNKTKEKHLISNATHVEDGRHPIFYNFYVPPENYREAILIAQEQMRQRELLTPQAPLYYTLIAYPNVTSKFCEPNCWQREYLEHGHEVDTQQALWEYCRNAPDDEWVTYIHDKGSFHSNGNNKRARKIATRAALGCRKLLLNRDPSSHNWNVCGASFSVLPQYQTNANMWTAKCSYVRQLYEPVQYSQAIERMYNATLLNPVHGNTTYACLQPSTWRGSHVGTGRYAGERWIYSHPDVRPCSSLGWTNMAKATLDFAPRLTKEPKLRANFSPLKDSRFHNSFARLEGRLFEWDYLYGKKPPLNSWIWNYYKNFQTGTDTYLRECKDVADATMAAMANAGL